MRSGKDQYRITGGFYYDEKYEKNDCTGLRCHDDRIYGDHRMRQGGWTDKGGDKNDSR